MPPKSEVHRHGSRGGHCCLTLGENDTYVLLDGSKLAAAVKTAAKVTPSTFTFESPANGTLYTSSAMSGTVSTTTKYSASEVSKMVYRPTRTTGTHTIRYAAYDGSAQIATGTINVVTSASTVEYHISANEKQQMVVSDFQRVYGSGLSTVTFGSNTDTRRAVQGQHDQLRQGRQRGLQRFDRLEPAEKRLLHRGQHHVEVHRDHPLHGKRLVRSDERPACGLCQ